MEALKAGQRAEIASRRVVEPDKLRPRRRGRLEAGLIDTNDFVEAIVKFGSGALVDDADKRAAAVELLGRAAPASLAEAIERMTNTMATPSSSLIIKRAPDSSRPMKCGFSAASRGLRSRPDAKMLRILSVPVPSAPQGLRQLPQ